jgi:hypothetical protein
MPSPFKTKEVTPVQKLAYFWTRLDDTTKRYFEQLYKMYPQDVSEVLVGEALLPARNCTTLQDWVDGKGGGGALTASDFSHVYISITDVKAEPEHVDSGKPFKIVWAGMADDDFPARKDTIIISDRQTNREVRTLTLAYPEIKAGSVKEEIDCGDLPDGVYAFVLTVNTEGTDHQTELTAQGIRNMQMGIVYVGESAAAKEARMAPIISGIQNKGNDATLAGPDGMLLPEGMRAIGEMAQLASTLDPPRLHEDNPELNREVKARAAEVSMALKTHADNLSRYQDPAQLLRPSQWPPLRERLQGLISTMTLDLPSFLDRLIVWLGDYVKIL